jgi:multiple sugar transport system permease protein
MTARDNGQVSGRGAMTSTTTTTAQQQQRLLPTTSFWVHWSAPAVMLIPTVAVLVALSLFPMFYSIWLSFNEWNLGDRTATWHFVGLKNFVTIFTTDPFFWPSVRVSVTFTGVTVAVQTLLGLGIALLFSDEFRGRGILRTLIVLPLMISPVVAGLIWRFMYNTDRGMVNYLLYLLGIEKVDWLGQQAYAMPAVMLADIWQWTPFVALILMAAIQALPDEPFEAALIDGAGKWQMFRYLTLPMIRPALMVAILIRTMDSFKIFDLIYVLTLGGPGVSTQVLGLYTYKWGFKFFQMGYASALSYLMIFMMVVIANIIVFVMRRRAD